MGDAQVERLAVLGPPGLAKSQIQTVLTTDDPKPVRFRRSPLRGYGPGAIRGTSGLLIGDDSGYSGGGDFGGGGDSSGGY